ncbi:MAG: SDR family oxidoreductase, partial [Proteobacteria bacterium]|nr:SDR family oxidoreductase [Pseudomonadota bacterium]
VNITGGPPPSPASGNAADVWTRYFDLMVQPVVRLTDRVLPHMRQSGWGRVVTSTSSGVVAPIPNLALSNSLRSALVGWSKTLAREVAADGVTVNNVLPGYTNTARLEKLFAAKADKSGQMPDAVSKAALEQVPMRRFAEPEETAAAIAFLASPSAAYITGVSLPVDGGRLHAI